MIAPGWETLRMFLHIVAATIWVGGQFTLAGLVSVVKGFSPDATRVVARRFAQLSWPAYGVLIITGIWNVIASNPAHQSGKWNGTLDIKLAVVALSGAAAFFHTRAKHKTTLALWGALTSLSALAALFLGVLLAQ